MTNEELYFYHISLSANFIPFEFYEKQLNEAFLADELNGLLLDLQLCFNDKRKTIKALDEYFYGKIKLLDYDIVGKMICDNIKKQYKLLPLKELAFKIYMLWKCIENHSSIALNEPFYTMMWLDDIFGDDEEQITKNVEWLINYYKRPQDVKNR